MPILTPGDPAPWFRAQTSSRPDYSFSTVAGRWVAIAFVPSSASEPGRRLRQAVAAGRGLFDDGRLAFFGVTADPEDERERRVADEPPGVRWFYDPAGEVAGLYGTRGGDGAVEPVWYVLDPMLRVVARGPVAEVGRMMQLIARLPPPDAHGGVEMVAPVLIVLRVFEPEFAKALIDCYRARGGEPSGFMVEEAGRTRLAHDPAHKRRSDHVIEDEALRSACRARIHRRLAPEIAKAFQFTATRIERYLVACYDAGEGGWFRPHRDNTTKGTAHRRFAVTINLNAEDYDGGELRFPEFGSRTYRAPTGGAVVFSCSLCTRRGRSRAGRATPSCRSSMTRKPRAKGPRITPGLTRASPPTSPDLLRARGWGGGPGSRAGAPG